MENHNEFELCRTSECPEENTGAFSRRWKSTWYHCVDGTTPRSRYNLSKSKPTL